jgi:hypothetical protein
MQLESNGGGNDISEPLNDDRNDAILRAIWEITENNTYQTPPSFPHGISTGVPNGYQDWIQWAEANVSGTDFSEWAVVSGTYQNAGAGWQLDAGGPMVQTFLAEVTPDPIQTASLTPEPGFYGILALGLVVVGYTIHRRERRKQASEAALRQ